MLLIPENHPQSEIIEKLIIVGLENMTKSDFVLPNSNNRLESAISHSFIKRMGRLKLVHITPSYKGSNNGFINYFINNGRINSYLEFMSNDDRIHQHINRFKKGGEYEAVGVKGNYAILNIDLTSLTMKSEKVREMNRIPSFTHF